MNPNSFRTAFALVGAPSCAKGTAVKLVFKDFCMRAGITLMEVPVSHFLLTYLQEIPDRLMAERLVDEMNSGALIPDSVANKVFEKAFEDIESKCSNIEEPVMIVLDGAPRTTGQINTTIFNMAERINIPMNNMNVVHVSTEVHVCAFRMALRGKPTDLSESVMSKRFSEFKAKTLPTINQLRDLSHDTSIVFREIDGQFMMDNAYSYQRSLFADYWPEFF